MGLLDQILGGALGGRGGLGGALGGTPGREPAGQAGGMGRVLIALLPVVLSMLANRRNAGGAADGSGGLGGLGDMLGGRAQAGSDGGGLGGLGGLGSILGGAGLGGLLDQFRQRGLASQADSWVSTGPNLPLAPEDVDGVFGAEGVSRIAQEAGLSDIETREGLAQLLPDVVDRLTPAGNLPPDDDVNTSLDDFLGQFRR